MISTHRLGLTEVLKHGNCETLRLLVGSIIRQMLFSGIPPEAFWTSQDIVIWREGFPLASEQSLQWIIDFNFYMQDMVRRCSLPELVNFCRWQAANTDDATEDQMSSSPAPRPSKIISPLQAMSQQYFCLSRPSFSRFLCNLSLVDKLPTWTFLLRTLSARNLYHPLSSVLKTPYVL